MILMYGSQQDYVAWPPMDSFFAVREGSGDTALICAGVALATALGLAVWGLTRARSSRRHGAIFLSKPPSPVS